MCSPTIIALIIGEKVTFTYLQTVINISFYFSRKHTTEEEGTLNNDEPSPRRIFA